MMRPARHFNRGRRDSARRELAKSAITGTGLMLVSGLGLLLMFSPVAPLAIVASPGLLAIFVLGILMLLPVVTAPFGMTLM